MKIKYIVVTVITMLVFGLLAGYYYSQNRSDNLEPADTTVVQTETAEDVPPEKPSEKKPKKQKKLSLDEKYYETYIKKANDAFLSKAVAGKNNDSEFYSLIKTYYKTTEKINEDLFEKNNYDDIPDKDYRNCWVKVLASEGAPYYVLNYSYLANKYEPYISQTYRDWLIFQGKTVHIVEDAGLTVTPDKLREYIIYLEKFTKKNPDFVALEDVKNMNFAFVNMYLAGLDNTPVFDWASNTMNPEFKASYEKFLKSNTDSQYYPTVKIMYEQAEKYRFVNTQKFEHWMINEFIPKYLR